MLDTRVAGRRGRWGTPRRGAVRLGLAVAFAIGGAAVLAITIAQRLPVSLTRAETLSPVVLDRHGQLLRAFTTPDGRWRMPVSAVDVDPQYLAMLLAYEDRRFRDHGGIDVRAFARAVGQLVRHGHIVSGASTLTMQVARLLAPPEAKGLSTKLEQMAHALALEHRLGKDDILDLYLRLAPFGGNIEGVRAASLAYFGKEPRRLSVAERALLVAIPQSPAARRPDKDPMAATRARNRVLARALAAGIISPTDAEAARHQPVPTLRRAFPRLAPHLAEAEIAKAPDATEHHLTIDRDAQAALEGLAREHAIRLGPRLSIALIAVEHRTGEIVAEVGSAGYLDTDRLGAIDMTSAIRSPGSTLKPLVYGLAFERGIAHPETLIEDRPARFGLYHPANFDQDFHGTVTMREALALSLNIPAVKVLAEVGPKRLIGRMRRAGINPQLPAGTEPSLAVALGGLGVSLHDLARLYTAIARGGEAVPLSHVLRAAETTRGIRDGARQRRTSTAGSSRAPLAPRVQPSCAGNSCPRLLSAAAAWYVADILKDAPPPASARGQRIAFKTGTSYGYRDAWAAGFDGRYVVAVWVGRADGTPSPGITGIGSAAPVLFDAVARLETHTVALATPPHGVLRARNGELPPTLRRFNEAAEGTTGQPAVAISFPPDRAELEQPLVDAPEVVLKAEGGALPLTWVVDGAPIAAAAGSREVAWTPAGLGFARITVFDAEGRADRVTVRIR